MTGVKVQPYERKREERFTIPFEDSGRVRDVCVEYQATECLEDNQLILCRERCRISSVNMNFWFISYFGDRKTLRQEYPSNIALNRKCLATLKEKLPDYVCKILPE